MHTVPSPRLPTDDAQTEPMHPGAPERAACRRLTAAARRAACRSLPDDDATLARAARLDQQTWRCIKPAVMASWTLADGRWTPQFSRLGRGLAPRRASPSPLWGGSARVLGHASRGGGTAPATPADVRALVRAQTADAIAALAAIMHDCTALPRARVSAAQALLDRGLGKVTQEAKEELGPVERPTIRWVFVKPEWPPDTPGLHYQAHDDP